MSARSAVFAGATLWARGDLRRRWRSLVALGILAGLAAGLAMASVAGARRTSSAFDRLRSITQASDAIVFPGQVGAIEADWDHLRAKPYVESVAPWSLLFGSTDGKQGALILGPLDDQWLQDVDRPIVIEGRAFDPSVPTEVVIDGTHPEKLGLHVGSTVSYQFYDKESSDVSGEPPRGLTLDLKVVGVVRTTGRYLFSEQIIASPALVRTYGDRIQTIENAHVRLRDPATAMSTLQRDANELAPGTPILDLHRVQARVGTAITVEHAALLLLAAAVAAASLVFVGQAVARSVAVIDPDRSALRSFGVTRSEQAAAASLPHLLVALVAGFVAAAVAVALSPRFPIGYAATIEPDPGLHVDWTVLPAGVLLTILVVVVAAVLTAWRRGQPNPVERSGRSVLAPVVRQHAPLPVGVGVTMAMDPGRGRVAIPVRPALVGAVVGMIGLGATVTVHRGLTQSLDHPELAGVTWDASVAPSSQAIDLDDPDQLDDAYLRRVVDSAGVGAVTVMWRAVVEVNKVGLPAIATVPVRGDIDLVLLDGRPPTKPDDVTLGPASARLLGVSVGDRVRVGGRRLTVVGHALFPVEVHNGFDEGLWVTRDTLREISPPVDLETAEGAFPSFFVDWERGADPQRALAGLARRVPDAFAIDPASIPEELANLDNVRTVPIVLAGFLVLLAIASLLHALATTVRARRREFAVLRALGFTRRMLASAVAIQGTTVALYGLVIGLPIGLVTGRWVWRWVSDQVPIVFVSPIALGILALVIPGAVLAANLLAAGPAQQAIRLRPATVLRTE